MTTYQSKWTQGGLFRVHFTVNTKLSTTSFPNSHPTHPKSSPTASFKRSLSVNDCPDLFNDAAAPPNGGVYSLQTLRHAVSFSASPGGMSWSAAPTRRCWPRLSLAPDITADGGAFFRGARALDSLRNLFGRTTVTAVAKRMRVLGAWRRTCSETVNKAGFVVVSWARRRGRDVFF